MHNKPQKVAKTFEEILKFNDRHDPKTGRFAPKNGGASGSGSNDDFDPYALLMAAAAEAEANPATTATLAPDPEPQKQMPKSKLSEATMAKCEEVERASLGMRNEQMTVIDGNGNIVVQKEGKPDGVDFTIGDLHKMENRVITHNHPQEFGGTFSPRDISTFQAGNAKAIRIVANEGT